MSSQINENCIHYNNGYCGDVARKYFCDYDKRECICYQPKNDKKDDKKVEGCPNCAYFDRKSSRCAMGRDIPEGGQDQCASFYYTKQAEIDLKEIRQHAIDKGMKLKTEEEIQQEIEVNRAGKKLAEKETAGKIRLDLDPIEPMYCRAQVYQWAHEHDGKAEDNHTLGIPWRELYRAAFHHLTEWAMGNKYDDKSGLPHTWHLGCVADMIINMETHRPDLNNLPVFGKEGKPGKRDGK